MAVVPYDMLSGTTDFQMRYDSQTIVQTRISGAYIFRLLI